MNTQAYYPITKEQLQLKEDTTKLTKMRLGAIHIIRDTLGGGGQTICHQKTHGGGGWRKCNVKFLGKFLGF